MRTEQAVKSEITRISVFISELCLMGEFGTAEYFKGKQDGLRWVLSTRGKKEVYEVGGSKE